LIDESKYIAEVEAREEEAGSRRDTKNGLLYKDGRLDKDHYLRPDSEIEKETDKFRIALVGDSYTKGTGVRQREHEYDRQLQKAIDRDENFPESEVIKFTGDPFNSFQELIIVQELVLDYNPDIIILQFCTNDLQATRSHVGTKGGDDKYVFVNTDFIIEDNQVMPSLPFLSRDINRAIIPHSSFLRFLSYKINSGRSIREQDTSLALDSITKIKELTLEKNIPLFIINFPSTRSEEVFCNEHIGNGIKNKVAGLSQELNIPFYDLCHDLDPNRHNSKYNSSHYNKEGYGVAARQIKKMIENSYLNDKEQRQ
jgi:hypothetical protein